MACIYNNSISINNSLISKSLEKSSLTPASSMKKLLKTVRKIIFNSKKQCKVIKPVATVIISGCRTEEEHQNWLNEQFEASFLSQQVEL